eukprot:gene12489-2278_t
MSTVSEELAEVKRQLLKEEGNMSLDSASSSVRSTPSKGVSRRMKDVLAAQDFEVLQDDAMSRAAEQEVMSASSQKLALYKERAALQAETQQLSSKASPRAHKVLSLSWANTRTPSLFTAVAESSGLDTDMMSQLDLRIARAKAALEQEPPLDDLQARHAAEDAAFAAMTAEKEKEVPFPTLVAAGSTAPAVDALPATGTIAPDESFFISSLLLWYSMEHQLTRVVCDGRKYSELSMATVSLREELQQQDEAYSQELEALRREQDD